MELCNLDFKVEAVLPQTTTSPHPPADLPKNMDQLGGAPCHDLRGQSV